MSITEEKIVITGIGLTAPNGNSWSEFRHSLLHGISGITNMETRYIGSVHAGVCDFDALKYQRKKDLRTSTRAGSIAIYCAGEALESAGLIVSDENRSRIGVYIGTTEHGNVETENEIFNISQYDYDTSYWSHHHNPRSIANNPAGEITIKFGVTGPHYCIGAACAAGNAGLIQGLQQLRLGEVDFALAGGISESIHTFGIFAGFNSQNALARHEDPKKASRPMDMARNGIVISEGGCIYVLERYEDAKRRGANILGEIAGYAINSDASNAVLPDSTRQAQCVNAALAKANMKIDEIDIINTHGTGTKMGDIQECQALRSLVGDCGNAPLINNTKGFIGHAMGAAGALELAGNLAAFSDNLAHPCMNLVDLDPECELPNIVMNEPVEKANIRSILNNSFGMLGINSTLIVRKV